MKRRAWSARSFAAKLAQSKPNRYDGGRRHPRHRAQCIKLRQPDEADRRGHQGRMTSAARNIAR